MVVPSGDTTRPSADLAAGADANSVADADADAESE